MSDKELLSPMNLQVELALARKKHLVQNYFLGSIALPGFYAHDFLQYGTEGGRDYNVRLLCLIQVPCVHMLVGQYL